MVKKTHLYICSNCNTAYPKWTGYCKNCNEWNTIDETTVSPNSFYSKNNLNSSFNKLEFADFSTKTASIPRLLSQIKEFDRVCGGGIVAGSAILVGGDPGIGKSTLLMQVVANLSLRYSCIYISGEESLDQLKRRAIRLNISTENLKVATALGVNDIIASLEKNTPQVLIIDSIQTMYLDTINSIPGSINQVKACTSELVNFCKKNNIALIIIGHVTREGQIAGPKVLEHTVDCVLYFEGEKNHNFRILRAVKNRFGATDEIGIFEMLEKGLHEVSNPSALFLHDYLINTSGTAVFSGIEGLRPILVEVQSLLVNTVFASPKRAVVGADNNRLSMITAVLESRAGLLFSNKDIYLNIAGGLKIYDPALDLAICASVISAFFDLAVPAHTVFFGELSLSGQIRNVSHIDKRLAESARLGFSTAIIPKLQDKQKKLLLTALKDSINIIEISNISQIIQLIKTTQNK